MAGKIIVLSGFSGVGKNTIINEIRNDYPSLVYIPSMTTRKMREGESEGFPYFFVTREQFKERIEKNYFIEYEPIHENWYGTPKDKYYEAIEQDKIVIKDIDVNGAIRMKEEFGDSTVLIFVEPPSVEELKKRLVGRGDNTDDIITRMKRIDFEASKKPFFDEFVVNDDLHKAVNDCKEIIKKYTGKEIPIKKKMIIDELLPTTSVSLINRKKISAISDVIKSGKQLPLPIIFIENGKKYIIDGHHRVLGAVDAGHNEIDVDEITAENLKGYHVESIHTVSYHTIQEWQVLLKELTKNGQL